MSKLIIIKIGGKVIDDKAQLSKVLASFSKIEGRKILVHGGGSLASKMEESMGQVPQMIEGRRVTSKESLDIVTMVYAGLISKNIVALLQAHGANAISLTGADGNAIRTKRRSPEPIDYGFVGDVEEVNGRMLNKLVDLDLIPVISAITHDGKGQLLNTNADTMAAEIAKVMAEGNEVELVMAFEKSGVLDGEGKVIPEINHNMFTKLVEEGIIVEGMIPKLSNAFSAIENGVEQVKLVSSEYLLDNKLEFTTISKL